MTEKTETQAGGAPAPGAAPASAPAAPEPDLAARIRAAEAELAALRSQQVTAAGTVKLRLVRGRAALTR